MMVIKLRDPDTDYSSQGGPSMSDPWVIARDGPVPNGWDGRVVKTSIYLGKTEEDWVTYFLNRMPGDSVPLVASDVGQGVHQSVQPDTEVCMILIGWLMRKLARQTARIDELEERLHTVEMDDGLIG